MRKGRRGFSLVEVVCAMTVVTIISAVTIGLISSSNRVMSNSKLAVGAANEARTIIDCYTAAVIQAQAQAQGDSPNDNFEIYISKLYGTTTGYAYSYDDEKKSDTYTFYYNGKYELVSEEAYTVRLELTTIDGEQPAVKVIRYDKNKKNEKTLFSN